MDEDRGRGLDRDWDRGAEAYYKLTGTVRYPITLKTTLIARKTTSVSDWMRGGTVPQPTFWARRSPSVAGMVKAPLHHEAKDENAPEGAWWRDEGFFARRELDTAEKMWVTVPRATTTAQKMIMEEP